MAQLRSSGLTEQTSPELASITSTLNMIQRQMAIIKQRQQLQAQTSQQQGPGSGQGQQQQQPQGMPSPQSASGNRQQQFPQNQAQGMPNGQMPQGSVNMNQQRPPMQQMQMPRESLLVLVATVESHTMSPRTRADHVV